MSQFLVMEVQYMETMIKHKDFKKFPNLELRWVTFDSLNYITGFGGKYKRK